VFKKYGAIELVECWSDAEPAGETTSFPMATFTALKALLLVCREQTSSAKRLVKQEFN